MPHGDEEYIAPEPQLPAEETQDTVWEDVTPEGGVCEIYSNFLDVHWTRYDIRLKFAQVLPGRRPNTWATEQRAAVTLAWPEAKVLRDLLVGLIDKYEKLNGELKIPELPG